MASISASSTTASFARTDPVQRGNVGLASHSSLVLGIPARARRGKVQCSVDEKPAAGNTTSMGAFSITVAHIAGMSSPALALVDERMSTEGTGLSLGLSNNLLGWILVGVFGLIWALYFVYTSTLDEDEDSGLSL